MSIQAKSKPLHARRGVATLTALLAAAALLVATTARAQVAPQSLPVTVQASGNTATIEVKLGTQVLADLTLSFDDASGLSPSSLGVSAELVSATSPSLLNRLPDSQLTQVPGALPLLVTIEPPANGGLSFDRTVRVEVHTHLLAYTTGSSFRLFKAPLGGDFRDITDEVAPGSVRARGTTGGFSQFLVLADLRETGDVVAEKTAWLRDRIDTLPSSERGRSMPTWTPPSRQWPAATSPMRSQRSTCSVRAPRPGPATSSTRPGPPPASPAMTRAS